MKIAIVSTGLGHTQRGIESWAKALAEGLQRSGEDVTLFHGGGEYGCENRKLRYLKRGDGLTRILAQLAPAFTWRWGWKAPYSIEQRSFARALLPFLESERIDIVHTQDIVLAELLEEYRRQEKIAARTIFAHGTDEDLNRLAQFRYLQHLSPAHAEKARAVIGDSSMHFCIPNFVDTAIFSPVGEELGSSSNTPTLRYSDTPIHSSLRQQLGIPSDAFVIGCSAALKITHKRLDALINEVANLSSVIRHPLSIFLLLAGAVSDETEALERLAAERLGDRCRILKDLPFHEMPDFYRALDLYVHPAPEEFFGICLLEAMACGIPVLVHSDPTLKWIVGDGGWICDVGREQFLVDMWSRMVSELPRKRELARTHVIEKFSWEAVHSQFMTMYECIMADDRTI